MKSTFYLDNGDGSFTTIFNDICNIYDRPYKGHYFYSYERNKSYCVYDIEIKNDIMKCYCCDINDERLKEVEMWEVEVTYNTGEENIYCMSPEKYLEGKKCNIPYGYFIIGKILKKYTAFDVSEKHAIELNKHVTCNPVCQI